MVLCPIPSVLIYLVSRRQTGPLRPNMSIMIGAKYGMIARKYGTSMKPLTTTIVPQKAMRISPMNCDAAYTERRNVVI